MDDRTTLLLDALDGLGVSLLVELLGAPATEATLVVAMTDATQPTVNRRLTRLRDARLVAHEPGNLKAPGRAWTVVHPVETEALLTALFTLSQSIAVEDARRRKAVTDKLKRARAARLGLRVVEKQSRRPDE